MASDLNQCNFIGRLGKDVETRYTQGGDAVANFSIAVGESWKDASGEKVEKTEWIRVVAFKKLAEICTEYLHKGSKVFISGKMTTRKWQNKEGVDQYSTEIVANQMSMLDSKPKDDAEPKREPVAKKPVDADELDSDIPF